MIGLYEFYIKGETFLNLLITVMPSTSISASSTNSFLSFGYNYLIVQYLYCGDVTPYLMTANNTCYDTCPERFYNDNINFICLACYYTCYQCNGPAATQCTVCNSTVDLRVLASGSCVPIDGYFDKPGSGPGLPTKCSTNCYACVTNPGKCTKCGKKQYLDSKSVCQSCVPNCDTCTNGLSCDSCDPFYTFNTTTLICTLTCSQMANCITCGVISSAVACFACSSGYIVSSTNNTIC